RGMERADEAQARDRADWAEHALNQIRKAALSNEYLDSDEVRRFNVDEPEHPAAWGSVWRRAVSAGWIEETLDIPRRKSSRPRAHASKMTMYKSLIWEGY